MNPTLTAIPGLKVGHWSNYDAGTGCTVILCGEGAVAGVDVRGGAPGTRETDLLRPECTVEYIHAILLSGGSAFGLAAADGVMRWLEEHNIGYDVGVARVPIAPAAILFDLPVGRPDVRPGPQAGYLACAVAHGGAVEQGCIGAGVGASIGKALGIKRACKGGLGSASLHQANGLIVSALAVVNAFGNVQDVQTGRILAGVRDLDEQGRFCGFLDAVTILGERGQADFTGSNTTLAVVATNGRLDKRAMSKVAQMAHDGLARTIRPVHTGLDGDVVFALSCGDHPTNTDIIGMLAADALAQAVVNAVQAASSLYNLPAARDL
jgi:L-aminopeptidase/D-esterase-like protein